MSDVRVVLVTTADREAALTLAERLVDERLAACGNVLGGVTSVFRWEGRVQRSDEALLILKTTADGVARLESRVVELHDYDVPEVLALPVEVGHGAYEAWVESCVGSRA